MKKRQSLFIRMLTFLLCTVFLFSTLFMSYENTMIVKAVDVPDLLTDAVAVVAASLGLLFTGPTGVAVATTLIPLMANEGKDVYYYITENDDGTTTISEEFIQLTLSAYQDYIKENFDGTLSYNPDGGYYEYGPSVFEVDYFVGVDPAFSRSENSGFSYTYPVALFLVNGDPNDKGTYKRYKVTPYFFNGNVDSAGGGIFEVDKYKSLFVQQPTGTMYMNSGSGTTSYQYTGLQFAQPGVGINVTSSCSLTCPTIPVYTSYEIMKADLQSGKFTNAENYRMSGQTSMYTGSYGGGNITVQTEKLGNIEEKLDEINETDKSIDDKLQDLLDWLGIGGGSGSGGIGAPSGWYETVLAYLESILQALEALVWIEADDSISEDRKDLFDLIDKIWQDPENGSQEAADALSGSFSDVARGLTKKFPFSIPWDIHALFSVFANAGNPEPAVMSYSTEPAVLYADGGSIQTYAGDSGIITLEDHNAPYFILPLVIESWGINEQVEIDLKDFQTLSTLSRTLFSLLFAVFLIKFTISVIKIYKGGNGD